MKLQQQIIRDLYFLNFHVLLCVLYGRITGWKNGPFVTELAAVTVGLGS